MQFESNAPIAIHHTLSQIPPNDGSSETRPIQTLVADAHGKAYNYICIPLTNESWRTRWRETCVASAEKKSGAAKRVEVWEDGSGFKLEELTLTRLDDSDRVIGLVSEWLELDSPDDGTRYASEIALLQELSYASYLNVQTVILPPPRNRVQVASYARAINAALLGTSGTPSMQISIRIPMHNILTTITVSGSVIDVLAPRVSTPTLAGVALRPTGDLSNMWEMWDVIKTICSYNARLSLTLDLTPPLPSNPKLLARWIAEPTRYLFLPASTFLENTKGYPVLPKHMQNFIRDIIIQRPTVILSETGSSLHKSGGESAYLQYVRHLEKTSPGVRAAETEGTVENFARGYQDYLQAPLQPLMDNLQSVTYEMFERDPIKYAQYEKAVYLALCDRLVGDRTVICVVGAGRGPLVAGSLRAAGNSGRMVKIYAIEKNPNAYVTLQARKQSEWGDGVTIVFGDMRSVELPEKVDIVVSELLGSFGDNELSPECLDGAVRFLKPGGISIPSSYTAHLAPLSSSKLFSEVNNGSKSDKMAETPYVVMFQAVNILSGNGGGPRSRCGTQVQECWQFEHPGKNAMLDAKGLPLTNNHNVRSAHLVFHIPYAGVLHGLAGYFEAVLYRDVGLSIHPDRKDRISPNMLSWFPLYFPFKDVLYLPMNSELHVSIWRMTDRRKVWYEWYAEAFLPMARASPLLETPASPAMRPAAGVSGDGEEMRPLLSPGSHSPGLPLPSPMLDANQPLWDRNIVDVSPDPVKIGQTCLHNPGGRSSWIGL